MTASSSRTTYHMRAAGDRPRPQRATAPHPLEVRDGRRDLDHRRLAHASPSWPRSRMRTLKIEKRRVMASSAMAIADAYPAWLFTKACFQR